MRTSVRITNAKRFKTFVSSDKACAGLGSWAHTKEEDRDTVSAMMTRSGVGWRSRSGQLWE